MMPKLYEERASLPLRPPQPAAEPAMPACSATSLLFTKNPIL